LPYWNQDFELVSQLPNSYKLNQISIRIFDYKKWPAPCNVLLQVLFRFLGGYTILKR